MESSEVRWGRVRLGSVRSGLLVSSLLLTCVVLLYVTFCTLLSVSVLLHVMFHPAVHAHPTVEQDVCGAGGAERSNMTPSLSTWRLVILTPIRVFLSFPFPKIAPLPFPSPQVQEP